MEYLNNMFELNSRILINLKKNYFFLSEWIVFRFKNIKMLEIKYKF